MHKKTFLLIGTLLVLCVLAVLLAIKPTKKPDKTNQRTEVLPTVVPYNSFTIGATFPPDNALNVSTGEIPITFTANVPITQAGDFSMHINPPIQYSLQPANTFPTLQVTERVLGGLKANTTYMVTVRDKNNIAVKSWKFTTSDRRAQSSSLLVSKEQEEINKKYYPHFNYVPYGNADFSIDYTGRLALTVTIKQNNAESIKKEVTGWILQKGVNPQSHTIEYKNAF